MQETSSITALLPTNGLPAVEGECAWRVALSRFLGTALDPLLAHLSRSNLRYISAKIQPSSARGRRIVEQIRKEFAPALEPFMVHYDTELLLLGFWMVSSEAFFAPYLSRAEKEEIAVNVSRGNQCDYCACAHELIGSASVGCVPRAVSCPAPARMAEEIAITRVFNYINRMMLVFTYEPNRFLRRNFLLPITHTIAHLRIGPEARRKHEQGLSLQLIEDGDPEPAENDKHLFAWAEPIPGVNRAFQQWHAIMLETERRLEVSPAVKTHLRNLVFQPVATAIVEKSDGELVKFAEQLIQTPGHLEFPDPQGTLRRRFSSDAAWVNFVAWSSYLATLMKASVP
jgi:hypothetical protein